MQRIRVSDDFFLDEFIPPEMYLRFGALSMQWLRPEVVKSSQILRNIFGPSVINNWSQGGKVSAEEFLKYPIEVQEQFYTESGIRLPGTQTGATFSMHKYGCAADQKFKNADPDTVRKFIKSNYHKTFKSAGITRLEAHTPTWVHHDCANTGSKELIVFNP